jgi:hypothetical protein
MVNASRGQGTPTLARRLRPRGPPNGSNPAPRRLRILNGIERPGALAAILALNAIPLWGVFALGWQSYDLILLYWLENVLIGAFTVLRFVVRPYQHPLDLVMPLFLAPFFAVHYGGFCWGHGYFVVSLLGDADGPGGLFPAVQAALDATPMQVAVGGLFALQALDWWRSVRRQGLGGEGVRTLMIAPYRRVVVLHLTILLSGLALGALDEPTAGLVILVVLKTAFDVHYARRDATEGDDGADAPLTEEEMAEMAEMFPRPVVTVNGNEIEYDSFAELRDSRHYRMMTAILRLMGLGDDLRKIRSYLAYRVEEERAGR